MVVGAACPWECGLRINRGFRFVKSTDVTLHTAEAWDRLTFGGPAVTPQTLFVDEDSARTPRTGPGPDQAKRPGRGSRVLGKESSRTSHDFSGLARKPLIQNLLAIVAVIGPRLALSRES
jgi:hypothetical protein